MGNNAGTGFGIGIATLFGFGDLVDPRKTKRSDLDNLKTTIQTSVNANTLQALEKGTQIQKDLHQYISSKSTEMQNYIQTTNEALWESIEEDNLFIVILFIAILIIMIFNLIS